MGSSLGFRAAKNLFGGTGGGMGAKGGGGGGERRGVVGGLPVRNVESIEIYLSVYTYLNNYPGRPSLSL